MVVPNLAAFSAITGKTFTCGIGTPVLGNGSADCQEQSRAADVTIGTGLTVSEGGPGVWVPYVPSRALYGYATAGSTWMGTGPFSGCHIALFTKDGRLGMAHIAKESNTSASGVAWTAFTKAGGVTVLNEWKVSMPDQSRYSASYIFLDLSNPRSVALAKVDVHVTGMGGSDGTIFGISKVL